MISGPVSNSFRYSRSTSSGSALIAMTSSSELKSRRITREEDVPELVLFDELGSDFKSESFGFQERLLDSLFQALGMNLTEFDLQPLHDGGRYGLNGVTAVPNSTAILHGLVRVS